MCQVSELLVAQFEHYPPVTDVVEYGSAKEFAKPGANSFIRWSARNSNNIHVRLSSILKPDQFIFGQLFANLFANPEWGILKPAGIEPLP